MNISNKMLGLVVAVSMVQVQASQYANFMNPVYNQVQNLSANTQKALGAAAITGIAHTLLHHTSLDYKSALLITEVMGLVYLTGATAKLVKNIIQTVDAFITNYTPVTGSDALQLCAIVYFTHKVGILTKVVNGNTILPTISQLFAGPMQTAASYIAALGEKTTAAIPK